MAGAEYDDGFGRNAQLLDGIGKFILQQAYGIVENNFRGHAGHFIFQKIYRDIAPLVVKNRMRVNDALRGALLVLEAQVDGANTFLGKLLAPVVDGFCTARRRIFKLVFYKSVLPPEFRQHLSGSVLQAAEAGRKFPVEQPPHKYYLVHLPKQLPGALRQGESLILSQIHMAV